MADTWQRLGMMAAGMRNSGEDAYRKRLADNIGLGREGVALDMGLMKRDARTEFGDRLVGAGYSPQEAAVLEGLIQGESGSDFNAGMQGLGRRQEQQFRADAVDAASGGDWNLGNALLMGVANGPQALAAVDGDILLGNRFVEGGDSRGPTAIGQARVGQSNAAAASSYASAERARQGAGIDAARFNLQRSGQWNPDGVSAGAARGASGAGAGKPLPAEIRMKLGMLEAAELAARRYEEAVLPQGQFNRQALYVGPAGGNIEEAINNVLRVESGAAVPESEITSGVRRYGATALNQEETARANLQQLYDKIRILRENVTNQTGGAPAGLNVGDRLTAPAAPVSAPGTRRRFNPATGRIE
jgi:hypothetical protein